MSWLYLVIAGCFEIFGVGSIKLFTTKKDLRSLLILILAFSGSFLFLYLGMRQLPMGVSYFFNHCFCDWFKINWLESKRTLFGLLKDR